MMKPISQIPESAAAVTIPRGAFSLHLAPDAAIFPYALLGTLLSPMSAGYFT
jgi:hypothetical protein